MVFRDRAEAGRLLAEALMPFAASDCVILALPRGGVVLGVEIAKALHAPLDLAITRKIGHPMNPEYAICALAEDGQMVCNEQERAGVDEAWFTQAVAHERREAQRRHERYLAGRPSVPLTGKVAILVDDGIATGLTMRAAIKQVRVRQPRQLVVAVPVIPPETAEILRQEADQVVALEIPEYFLGAVGAYYADFRPVSDDEVIRLLRQDPLYLFAVAQYHALASSLVETGTQFGECHPLRYANGELAITFAPEVAENPCLVVGSLTPPDENLLQTLLLCDTVKRNGATEITALLPYLAYMRQDKPETRHSRATPWIGALMQASGIDRVLTIDIHSEHAIKAIPLPVESLSPAGLFAAEIHRLGWEDATIVAPDAGAIDRANAVLQAADMQAPMAYFEKHRVPDGVRSILHGAVGERAVVIDDILDTGNTLLACCRQLRDAGARMISVMVTHGLFTGEAWTGLWALGVSHIYCTDTVPLPSQLSALPITVIPVAPLIREWRAQ